MQNLPPSLRAVVHAIGDIEHMTAQRLREIVASADVAAGDLLDWAAYDHAPADSYGRRLIYDGGSFEVMAMSWEPGDYSAIHDHGNSMWGAVQVFGPAEHAVFMFDGECFRTLNRVILKPGQVMAVGHELIHQMGNPGAEQFMSLHIYGNPDLESCITADSRLFDFARGAESITDGGAFFSPREAQVKTTAPCSPSDYCTWLFDLLQHAERNRRANAPINDLLAELADPARWVSLRADLQTRIDERGHVTDSRYWRWLCDALTRAAALQERARSEAATDDGRDAAWRTYAENYDHVIGTTNSYIPHYLEKIFNRFAIDARTTSFLDVGCGTGWLEPMLIERFGMDPQRVLGVDPSPAMLEVARRRTNVQQAGLLDVGPEPGAFAVTFCNSYQYLPHEEFEAAVANMWTVTQPGGLCIGEFITQDHIRWYPNVVFSENDLVASLRTPRLCERDGYTYQESEILNVNRQDGMAITHEGVHRRFMISPRRVREVFAAVFGGEIAIFDAHTFAEILEPHETCTSTRFVACARRATE